MILELCALSADFPASLLDRLTGSSQWTQKTVCQLIKNNMIRRLYKDKLRSLRLTSKGRKTMLEENRERYCMLLDGAGATRFRKADPVTRTRLHRMAGVYLLMLEAGVAVHRDEKADIFRDQHSDADPASVLERWSVPCFYSSVEVKTQGDDIIRIKGTRAVGALFTDAPSSYLVYNTGNLPMRWSEKAEQKLSGVIQGALNDWQIETSEISGIMAGNDMEVLLRLLTSDGGYNNKFYKVDNAYQIIHFVPIDQNGKLMLRLLCCESAKQRISERLMASFTPPGHYIFACDAKDNDRPVLFAWDLDMKKLIRFKQGLETEKENGLVVCMDFQAGILQKYFGNLAEIRPLDSELFKKELLNGS